MIAPGAGLCRPSPELVRYRNWACWVKSTCFEMTIRNSLPAAMSQQWARIRRSFLLYCYSYPGLARSSPDLDCYWDDACPNTAWNYGVDLHQTSDLTGRPTGV